MFSDALDREVAWLRSFGDGLPALISAADGPFQVVQARWTRVPATRKTGLYVLRSAYHFGRFSSQRSINTTIFRLRLIWPMSQGSGSAEKEQLLFDEAIDAVITRVAGPLGDKSHGGRFLSVAENEAGIGVDYADPEQSLVSGGIFRADVTYSADDYDITN